MQNAGGSVLGGKYNPINKGQTNVIKYSSNVNNK